jgi:hypothetical protein
VLRLSVGNRDIETRRVRSGNSSAMRSGDAGDIRQGMQDVK